jgi:hypothetical protein
LQARQLFVQHTELSSHGSGKLKAWGKVWLFPSLSRKRLGKVKA